MDGEISTLPGAAQAHLWSDGQIRLAAKKTLLNVTKYRTYVVSANALGLKPGGWLSEAVEANQAILHCTVAYAVVNTINSLASAPELLTILNKPISRLTEEDVIRVYEAIDAAAISRGPRVAHQYAQKSRHFFHRPTTSISNGTLLCDVEYHTNLHAPSSRANDTLSDHVNLNILDPELARPAAALSFTDIENLKAKQLAHFTGRLDELVTKCIGLLDAHDALVATIKSRRAQGLPVSLPPQTRGAMKKPKAFSTRHPKLPADVRLPWAVRALDSKQLHISGNFCKLDLNGINEFETLAWRRTHRVYYSLLLSEFYLSRMVVIAAFIILLCATGWNASTLTIITPARLRRTTRRYEIAGFKSKNDQNENTTLLETGTEKVLSIFEANPAKPQLLVASHEIRAIEMLLQHHQNVKEYCKSESDSVFVTLALDEMSALNFRVMLDSSDIREFCTFVGHPHFHADDIRTQVHSAGYLKSGQNLRLTQAKLNHTRAATTARYVDGTALRISHEAIMRDYGDILSASFKFSVGRLKFENPTNGRREKLIRNLLLFPPTSYHTEIEDTIVDQWLAHEGRITFEIGIEELKHCAYQRRYYIAHTTKLISANEERFRRYHLPRILFCEALYKVIRESPLGGQLLAFEELLNAKNRAKSPDG